MKSPQGRFWKERAVLSAPPVSTICVFSRNSPPYLFKQTLIKDRRLSSMFFLDFQGCFNFLINTEIISLKPSAFSPLRPSLFSCSSAWGGLILALNEHLLAPYWHRNKIIQHVVFGNLKAPWWILQNYIMSLTFKGFIILSSIIHKGFSPPKACMGFWRSSEPTAETMEDYIKTWSSPFSFGTICLWGDLKTPFSMLKTELNSLWAWALWFEEHRWSGDAVYVQCDRLFMCRVTRVPGHSGEVLLRISQWCSNFIYYKTLTGLPVCAQSGTLKSNVKQGGLLNASWIIVCFSAGVLTLACSASDCIVVVAPTNSGVLKSVRERMCVCVRVCVVDPVITEI